MAFSPGCGCGSGGGSRADAGEGEGEDNGNNEPTAGSDGTGTSPEDCEPADTGEGAEGEPSDIMSHARQLRRLTVSLVARFPTDEELEALKQTAESARDGWIKNKAQELLDSPAFYQSMLAFGHRVMPMKPTPAYADFPSYEANLAKTVVPCGPDTVHAGKWARYWTACDDPAAAQRTDEPWWAEGTLITIVGDGSRVDTHVQNEQGNTVDCGRASSGFVYEGDSPCGCGPNLLYCYPAHNATDYRAFLPNNPVGHRRQLWEEPARLIAHLAWHDRPLSDALLGDYSVGTLQVQHAYVRWGRRTGSEITDTDGTWWHTSGWTTPADPEHDPTDPWAWSEFELQTRNPHLLSDRNTRFDPVTDPPDALVGIPAAGVGTMLGMFTGYPRERVRAARLLESFACEVFAPPPGDAHFTPYQTDPATEGTCQYCHVRIDPAAIHFKRIQRTGYSSFAMVAVQDDRIPPEWTSLQWPYGNDPYPRWLRSLVPGTRLTPISPEDFEANPDTLFIDYLPPDQTLLGQTSDGTIGPLGFGKMVVASGAFDRCMVRRLHEAVLGRDIDPTTEAGYLGALVAAFVDGERTVRPFILKLIQGETFQRGL